MNKLSTPEQEALKRVAADLRVPSDVLYKIIDYESAWNPKAKNPVSTARGLIQFTDPRAQDLGFRDSLDLVTKYPTRTTQLYGPVLSDLLSYGPYDDNQDLAMAIFYPAYRSVAPDTVFPERVTSDNPGINTPADYMRRAGILPTTGPDAVADIDRTALAPILIGVGALVLLLILIARRG